MLLLLLIENVVHYVKHLLLNLRLWVGVIYGALSLLWREHLTFYDRLRIGMVVLRAVEILVLDVDIIRDRLILQLVFVHRLHHVIHVDRLRMRKVLVHG